MMEVSGNMMQMRSVFIFFSPFISYQTAFTSPLECFVGQTTTLNICRHLCGTFLSFLKSPQLDSLDFEFTQIFLDCINTGLSEPLFLLIWLSAGVFMLINELCKHAIN